MRWGRLSVIAAAVAASAIVLPANGAATFRGKPGRIAFSYERSATETFAIESIRPSGSGRKKALVIESAHIPTGPAYSPDGQEIAFQANGNLQIVNADGSGLRTVTSGVYFDRVAFSPSGDRLVFAKQDGPAAGDVDIYTIRTDGTELTRLTEAPRQDREPTWSPDGRLIAFVSHRTGRAHVWLMRRDGSHQRMVDPLNGERMPDFAPNGHELVVSKGVSIMTMRLDGSHKHWLTASPTIAQDPVYSPDGRRVAAVYWTRRRRHNILVMNADGSHKRIIKVRVDGRGTSGMRGISWQPLPTRR
jgi:Tol biopolymer transport system component